MHGQTHIKYGPRYKVHSPRRVVSGNCAALVVILPKSFFFLIYYLFYRRVCWHLMVGHLLLVLFLPPFLRVPYHLHTFTLFPLSLLEENLLHVKNWPR